MASKQTRLDASIKKDIDRELKKKKRTAPRMTISDVIAGWKVDAEKWRATNAK